MSWLERHRSILYALLRFVSGAMFACHGAQKLFNVPSGGHSPHTPLIMVAGFIELVAGILIAIGLFAHFAAFISSGEMAVAYFMVHQPQGALPIQNQGELAVLYCFLFLYIAARGSGEYSVDAARRRGHR
jgi:putative oxidoreductase